QGLPAHAAQRRGLRGRTCAIARTRRILQSGVRRTARVTKSEPGEGSALSQGRYAGASSTRPSSNEDARRPALGESNRLHRRARPAFSAHGLLHGFLYFVPRNVLLERETGHMGAAAATVVMDAVNSAQHFVDVFIIVYSLLIFAYVIASWFRLPYSLNR